MKSFKYIQTVSPIEASEKIAQMGEEDARIIAGGTALVIMMKENILSPKVLLDISQIDSLRGITYSQEDGLCIGSMATHYEIENSPEVAEYYPSLKEAFHTIGNVRVRMAGTIGGNLAYAEPQCNPPAILSALGANVWVTDSLGKERAIRADEFIKGIFESDLRAGEIITKIIVPAPKARSRCSFSKFTTKSSTDKPTSTVAIYLEMDSSYQNIAESRIVVGAVGPKTYRCSKAEEYVKEAPVNSLDFRRAARVACEEFEAMDDLYGTAWYKKRVTESIIRSVLKETVELLLNSRSGERG